ncbi:hypothetical protein [Halocola ammonii]
MEDSTLDSKFNTEIGLTSYTLDYLQSAAKWAKFLSIVGFIGVALMVFLAFWVGNSFSAIGRGFGINQLGGLVFTIIYLVLAAVYFFPVFFLFRFSSKALIAIRRIDQHEMDESFSNLKAMFQYMGIVTIVGLTLNIFGYLFAMAI